MDNNDVFKRVRAILKLPNKVVVEVMAVGGHETTKSQVDRWLSAKDRTKKATGNSTANKVPMYKEMPTEALEAFIQGLTIYSFEDEATDK